MTNPQKHNNDPERHLQDALEQARRLSECSSAPRVTAGWSAHAAHVGDLSVLALALRS